ncbi:MAG: hypothetical protein ACR2PO_10795 [Methyloligellaceae bacterium]
MTFPTRHLVSAAGALALLGAATAPTLACEYMRSAYQSMTPAETVQTTVGQAAAVAKAEPAKAEATEAETVKAAEAQPEPAQVELAEAGEPKKQ